MEASRLGKQRNPIVVVLLSVITFGIYFVYWYYKINKEVVEYDQRIESSPLISVLAITLGAFLVIPPYASAYTTAARARRMFWDYGSSVEISPALAFLLYFFIAVGYPAVSLFYPAYVQSKLNRFWRRQASKVAVEARRAA
ncbi:MAG: DUF4234 domain-containing protein [Candidatus Aquicultorales bacterium]